MRWVVQFTARKRDPEGEPYRWRHGPYLERADAEARAAKLRRRKEKGRWVFKGRVRIEVVPYGVPRKRTKKGKRR